MRERWPKPRSESGPNQRWLRSSSAARRGPSAIAALPPPVRHRRQSGIAHRPAPVLYRLSHALRVDPRPTRPHSASATPCSPGSRPTAASTCPSEWPVLPSPSPGEPYARVAAGVVGAFAGDELAPALLERLCDEAYAGFRHPAVCPLVQLDADEWLLELFHGPTLAFKDLALQLVGRLFDHVLTQRGERITVLVGDLRRHRLGRDLRARLVQPRRGRRALSPRAA